MTGGCSSKKRRIGHSHTQRRMQQEVAILQAKERGLIGNWPCQLLDLLACRTRREYISLFKLSSLWHFVYSSKLAQKALISLPGRVGHAASHSPGRTVRGPSVIMCVT